MKTFTTRGIIALILLATSMTSYSQSKTPDMKTAPSFTILLLMNATPQWLRLSREERSAYFEKSIAPVFARVSKEVNVRLFDSEYFHAVVSDFMIITTQNLDQYQLLIELLRDSKIYHEPYFEIKDIIVGQENRFEDFNEVLIKKK
jgi:hypothetical protein